MSSKPRVITILIASILLVAPIASAAVTFVGTGAGLTGGPITTSGTISIGPHEVTAVMLQNGSVTNAKLTTNSVTASKILNGAVTTSKLSPGAVTDEKLGNLAVKTGKLAEGAVSTNKLMDGAVNASKLADASVDLVKLTFDPATQTELDAFISLLATPGTFNDAGNPVDWTVLKGVPPAVLDGTDADTLASLSCDATEIAKWDGATWQCADDEDTTYSAGDGLSLASTTFAVDTSMIQARVSGSCSLGSMIRAIAVDGSVTCAGDADTLAALSCAAGETIKWSGSEWQCQTDDSTSYSNGVGLDLVGTTFHVNTSVIQARVTGTCSAGESIQTILENGGVTCEPDDDTLAALACGTNEIAKWSGTMWTCAPDDDTLYTNGAGLALSGTEFSVDTSAIQSRVTGTCAAGSAMNAVLATGGVTCEVDDDTLYTNGTGLDLSGTAFSVNTSLIQSRVTGTCAAGTGIRDIGPMGTVTCEPDDDTLAALSCSMGQVAQWSGSAWDCATPSTTTYGNGFGLTLTGNTFSVNTTDVQRRISGSCAEGSSIRVVAVDGTVTCESDDNSGGTVTSVASGSGLTGGPITGSGTLSIAAGGVTSSMIQDGSVGFVDTNFIRNVAVVNIDVGNTNDGNTGCATATLTGALMTDKLIVTPSANMTDGWAYHGARVSATNTIEVCWINLTGSNSNPGTVPVWVIDLF